MDYKARKGWSIFFGIVSSIGTIVTAILVAKETPKAIEKIKELKKKENVKKIDYIKTLAPIYWPAATMCLGTIASQTISQVISIKTEASLIATSTMLSQGWNRYKYKVKEYLGPNAEKIIRADVAQDLFNKEKPNQIKKSKNCSKKLYYEEHLGWFYADPTDLQAGLEDINQRLYNPDPKNEGSFYWATLYLFAQDSKAHVLNQENLDACRHIGWTVEYVSEAYCKTFVWIHPEFVRVFDKETGVLLYTMITFWEEPIALIEEQLTKEYYKSKYDYMHEAESDINFIDDDEAALDLYYRGNVPNKFIEMEDADRRGPVYDRSDVYYKDCDDPISAQDVFTSSNQNNKEHLTDVYSDGTSCHDLKDIQELHLPEGPIPEEE